VFHTLTFMDDTFIVIISCSTTSSFLLICSISAILWIRQISLNREDKDGRLRKRNEEARQSKEGSSKGGSLVPRPFKKGPGIHCLRMCQIFTEFRETVFFSNFLRVIKATTSGLLGGASRSLVLILYCWSLCRFRCCY